ncbi:MAG TPA: nuclear transport factor 2 family protein [Gemmatimonadaceae bacterium]|nr:nuclear transport factor 2 family protein [Gemmatimonadaceae bacterium]
MKRTTILSAAAVALVSLASCSRAPKVDVPAEEKAVRAVSAHWLELENSRDAAGIAALFTDDGVEYRAHKDPAVGPAAIEAMSARAFTESPKLVVSWTTEAVTVAPSGDLAVEAGNYEITHAGALGNDSDKGAFLTVYKKVNNQWKVSRDMGSTTMPEAKPAPVKPAPKVTTASAKKPVTKTTKAPAKTTTKAPAKAPARTKR